MRRLRNLLSVLLIVCVPGFWQPHASAAGEKPASTGNDTLRYALLVGCTDYPHIPGHDLEGPANDVVLMRKVLVEQFHFPDKNIVTLAEAQGREDLRPIRKNIEREFQQLAEKATPGSKVVILLGGHGSREPDQRPDDPNRFKPDGLQEIFLPSDSEMGDDAGQVKNAIADYEFHDWLQKIRDKGASVWMIVDACHSASLARGVEKMREIKPEDLIPAKALEKASEHSRNMSEKERDDAEKAFPFKLPPDEPDLVAIYAAQYTEPTVEKLMPQDSANPKPHGLLTYTLCQVLTEAKSPLTYTELVERIQAKYQGWGRNSPTPLVEGKDKDREILGEKEHRYRSLIRLTTDKDGGLRINAGSLYGLTVGSVLAVYPPAGEENPDSLELYVKVISDGFTPLEARVEPCVFQGVNPPKALPTEGRCVPAYIDFGDLRIKVAIDSHTQANEPFPDAEQERLLQSLKKIEGADDSLIKVVALDKASWLLRCDSLKSGQLFLVPASGLLASDQSGKLTTQDLDNLPRLFGPVPAGDEMVPWLKDRLGRIARVQNMLDIASSPAFQLVQEDQGIKVKVELLRLRDNDDKIGEPINRGGTKIIFHDGDVIGVRISNEGREPVDVNLLYIDSDYGIMPFFPTTSGSFDNRLLPGGQARQRRAKIKSNTVGLERLVIIAVKTQEGFSPANFCFLAQPDIEQAKQDVPLSRGGQDRGLNSPLGRLLQKACYGEGTSRGFESTDSTYAFGLIPWQVAPKKGQ